MSGTQLALRSAGSADTRDLEARHLTMLRAAETREMVSAASTEDYRMLASPIKPRQAAAQAHR